LTHTNNKQNHMYIYRFDISDKEAVANHLKKLTSSPKQKKVLEFIISEYEKQKNNEHFFLKQKRYNADNQFVFKKLYNELEKKEHIKIIQKNISRVHAETQETQAIKSLDTNQTAAYEEIKQKLTHSNTLFAPWGYCQRKNRSVYYLYATHFVARQTGFIHCARNCTHNTNYLLVCKKYLAIKWEYIILV